jgi:hypothetical protein
LSLTGNTSEEKIWNFLKAKGLNDCGIAGLMGNLYAESGLRPNNLQNTYEKKLGYTDESYTAAVDSGQYANFAKDSAGYGLAQWTYHTRKAALLTFVQSCGASIGDLEAQLEFLWKELSESYRTTLAVLKSAATIRAASDRVLTDFERPADMGDTAKARRAEYGQKFYDKYKEEVSMSYTASKVLAVAIAEIGYMEKASNSQLDDKTANAGSANYTKYADFFDRECPNWYNGKKNGYAWCDMFVDYCFHMAFGHEKALSLLCQPEKSCGAGCTFSAGYFRSHGQFYTSNPKPGDQIFFGSSISNCTHTGIVEKVDGSTVYTIEGNTSNRVARRSYPLNSQNIVGYGRPKYDTEEADPKPVNPTPQPDKPTTLDVQVGDIVNFKGGKHYANAGATSGDTVKASLAKVTAVYPTGKHPVHLRAVNESGAFVSGVYGWVDTSSYTKQTAGGAVTSSDDLNVGDIVNFKGGTHYTSANATSGSTVKASKAKVTAKYNGKHPIHLRAINDSGAYISGVYGWVDLDAITVSGGAAKKTIDEVACEVINGKWGNGAERKSRLEAAGFDFAAVQKRVNELLG